MSENKHTPGQITALSDQFICHPASRSIDEIEMAGEIMRDLLKQRDELLSLVESFGHKPGCRKNAFGDQCTCGVDSAIACVKGGA